ncbi:MAG TPA: hypothetical protein H9786_00355, partial [Candidatus Brachybacterium merdavium]|nr:hypothetical protein [Candidatus Brachybacterium merdavium]
GPGQWALTADGERFEVFDQIEPLEAGSPGHGAPEVPLDGPAEQAGPHGLSPSLHARITARSTAASAHQVSTDRVVDEPTRPHLAAPQPAGVQLTEAARPGRRSNGIALALLVISAVCMIAALALVIAAARGGEDSAAASVSPPQAGSCQTTACTTDGEGPVR